MGIATTFQVNKRLTAQQLNLKPYLHVEQAVGQSIPAVAWTAVTFTTELVDTINGHDNTTNTARYTPLAAGFYKCSGQVGLPGAIAGPTAAIFRKNGLVVVGGRYRTSHAVNQGSLNNTVFAEATIQCNGTTDFIELYVWQNTGAARTTPVDDGRSFMIIDWRAP